MAIPAPEMLFKTPADMQKAIDDYFNSLIEEKWERHSVRVMKNRKESYVDEWKPVKDRFGNIVMHFKEQPTITGLAVFMDTSRETLMNYEKRDAYYKIVRRAKDKIHHYYEIAKDPPAVKIFKLKNFGWTDNHEIKTDQTIKAEVGLKVEPVDLDERISQIVSDELANALQ